MTREEAKKGMEEAMERKDYMMVILMYFTQFYMDEEEKA